MGRSGVGLTQRGCGWGRRLGAVGLSGADLGGQWQHWQWGWNQVQAPARQHQRWQWGSVRHRGALARPLRSCQLMGRMAVQERVAHGSMWPCVTGQTRMGWRVGAPQASWAEVLVLEGQGHRRGLQAQQAHRH